MNVDNSHSRSAAELADGLRVTWVGALANLLLVVIKIWVGIVARSQALIADGIHSLSDLFSDLVVYLGLHWGRKEADHNHPYGHARIETVAGMLTGLSLIAVGITLAYRAITSIYDGSPSIPGPAAIVAAAFSIVLKEGLYWYTIRVGQRIKSLALVGNAWHHRSDALSSLAVLAGVVAAQIKPEWRLADVLASVVVTYFVTRVGARLFWTAVKQVVDTAPDREILDQLQVAAFEVTGVEHAHDIRARYSGSHILVQIHIAVLPELTVREGHDIAEAVRHQLLSEVPEVASVLVHVDPYPLLDTDH